MPSIFALVGIAALIYFLGYPYRLLRNLYYAKRTGLPYWIIPFDQDAFLWMVLSVPLRPFLQRNLPAWMYERVGATIWGWEFHLKTSPWDKYAANTSDPRTLAWVTCGNFEINSWDTEFAAEVLKRSKDFIQPTFNTLFIGRFGHNVLTSDGEKWARQRKIIAQVINERLSKSIFDETVTQAKGLLDEVTDADQKASVDTVGMFDMMKKLTIHVLSGAGMGQPVSWDNQGEKPAAGYKMSYMESAKVIMEAVAGPIILPAWFLDNYPAFMPGYSFIKRLSCAIQEYPSHTRQMLRQENERQANSSDDVRANILSQLSQAARSDKTGQSLTEEEMIGNLFVFTAAGFDTTANTLSYALAALAQQPKWQDWMFEEIDAILPKDATTSVQYTDLFPQATRVMAVMLETLRLYTPLVHLAKQSTRDREQIIKTSKGTYRIPAGTQTYVSAIGLHLDPLVWRDLNKTAEDAKFAANEPDELIFRPSRWIVQDGTTKSLFRPPPASFVPWSYGPRSCPGMKMAQVEFVATFLTLFRTHRIAPVPLQLPLPGQPGLGTREETPDEVKLRMAEKIKDSLAILTLQINGIYDAAKPGNEANGINLRISRRK